jgi:DNA-binding NarL/FixJ family response regulator
MKLTRLKENKLEEIIVSTPNFKRIKAFYLWEKNLSRIEKSILSLYKLGMPPKIISKGLRMTLGTFYNHKTRMLSKYNSILLGLDKESSI